MTVDTAIHGRSQLLLYSYEQELDRSLEAYNALQTRVNTDIALTGTFTGTLFVILGAILNFAEKSSSWQLAVIYLPWAGLFSALFAWRFAKGIRNELGSVLEEAAKVEAERGHIVDIPVKPFTRRLSEEKDFLGVNRETYVFATIALLWAGYLVHAHNLVELAKTLARGFGIPI